MLCDVGEDTGLLEMFDSLVEGDVGSVSNWLASCGVVFGVPFIAMRCTSNWQMFSSVGETGSEMELEWLHGLEKRLAGWVSGFVRGLLGWVDGLE